MRNLNAKDRSTKLTGGGALPKEGAKLPKTAPLPDEFLRGGATGCWPKKVGVICVRGETPDAVNEVNGEAGLELPEEGEVFRNDLMPGSVGCCGCMASLKEESATRLARYAGISLLGSVDDVIPRGQK
jgi:hypothetical protein